MYVSVHQIHVVVAVRVKTSMFGYIQNKDNDRDRINLKSPNEELVECLGEREYKL